MNHHIVVNSVGRLAEFGSTIMTPLMYLASGTVFESPQLTHCWNNSRLSETKTFTLRRKLMVHTKGIPGEIPAGGVRFHIPILGGWRNYIVVRPLTHRGDWYVGWITKGGSGGISRIKVQGEVRVLRGPNNVNFFGLSASTMEHIWIHQVAEGKVGDGGRYSLAPLL